MIAKFLMTGVAGILDLLDRRLQGTGLVRLDLTGQPQLPGRCFQRARQLLEMRLLLPDRLPGAGMLRFLDLREVFPRLVGQAVELVRTLDETRPVKRNAAAQHAAQVFAGLEHLLENGLALAQRRIRVDAAARAEGQAGQQYNRKSFKSHGGFRSRETAASILA